MKITETVTISLECGNYEDINSIMSSIYQAGTINAPRQEGDSFDQCLKGMHEVVEELIQSAFDYGRNYEKEISR